jgi:hypothetical protein
MASLPYLALAVLGTVLPSTCPAQTPLTLAQFTDCIGPNVGGWGSTCELESNAAGYTITQSLTVTRSNITIEGEYPYPTLKRAAGSSQSLIVAPASTSPCPNTSGVGSPCFVNILNLVLDGYLSEGAPAGFAELNLYGCSYCQTNGVTFQNSPNFAALVSPSMPTVLDNSTFTNIAYGGIFVGTSTTACATPVYWYPHYCFFAVESNFTQNGAGARGPQPMNASIAYDFFSGNHDLCPYNAPGGQIDLDTYANGVSVEYNTFAEGPNCTNGFWAVGVELHGLNLTLTDNLIEYNAGEGIYMDGAQGVTITTDDPSEYQIVDNNLRGSGFSGCGGFPGIRVHSSNAQGRATENVTIENVWSVYNQSYGVEVSSCATTGPLINYVTIENNCVAGNLHGGLYLPALGSPNTISNNSTSCGGYGAIQAPERQVDPQAVASNVAIFEHIFTALPALSSVHRQAYLDHLGLSSQRDREVMEATAAQFQSQEDAFTQRAYAALSVGDAATHAEVVGQRAELLANTAVQLLGEHSVAGASRIASFVEGAAASVPRRAGN